MTITFQPEGKTIEIQPEQTILAAAHQAGVELVGTCGGKGRCQSCRIRLIRGEFSSPTDEEFRVISEQHIAQGIRLACQTTALTDGVAQILPPMTEQLHRILSDVERVDYHFAPDARKDVVVWPAVSSQPSDFEELCAALVGTGEAALKVSAIDLPAVRQLAAARSDMPPALTVARWQDAVIAVEPGDTREQLYGVAVDIGTTTVAAYLLDLHAGREIAVASALNGQTMYGGDVMSRIAFARQGEASLRRLHERVRATLNDLIEDLCQQADVDAQQIYEMALVGNSCMQHLFWNISPAHLGVAPYLPASRELCVATAREIGLNIFPQARVVTLPLIAGFVGADTVGVILATDLHARDKLTLAVDIGTNGEIVLGCKDRLIACSAAAGTAFEGAQITHGMRGASGAIDHVAIDEDAQCHVLGGIPARGICGSGLVDAVAQMLDVGLLNRSGRLLTPDEAERSGHPLPPNLRRRVIVAQKQRVFVLLDGEQTESGEPILLTQQDIRELQLAKGAIAAGIAVLLKRFGVQAGDLAEILLAGAFGNYLDRDSAARIGLIPALPLERIRSVGNAAGLGAQMALLSGAAKQEAAQIARRTEHVALTNDPDFQAIFAEQMAFPA